MRKMLATFFSVSATGRSSNEQMSAKAFLLFGAFLISIALVDGAESSPCIDANGAYIPGADCFPNKSNVTQQYFSITYSKTFKVFRYNNPTSGFQQFSILYQRGTSKPSTADAGVPSNFSGKVPVIEIPVREVAVQSTTGLAYFEFLGRRTAVRALISQSTNATTNPLDYLTSPCYLRLQSEGLLVPATHWETHNWTQYTVVFVSNTFEPYLLQNLDNAVVFTPHLAPGTLPRLNWLVATAAFFNLEGRANSIVANISSHYNCDQEEAQERKGRPIVGWISFFGGVLYEGLAATYKLNLVIGAGGKNATVCPRSSGCTSQNPPNITALRSIEVLILDNANYNFSTFESMLSSVTGQEALSSFPFMKSHEVYTIDKLQGPKGGLDWFEAALVEVDTQLEDMITILHPGVLPSHKRKWLRRITNERITKTSANQCKNVSAPLIVRSEEGLDHCHEHHGHGGVAGSTLPSLLLQVLISFLLLFALSSL